MTVQIVLFDENKLPKVTVKNVQNVLAQVKLKQLDSKMRSYSMKAHHLLIEKA